MRSARSLPCASERSLSRNRKRTNQTKRPNRSNRLSGPRQASRPNRPRPPKKRQARRAERPSALHATRNRPMATAALVAAATALPLLIFLAGIFAPATAAGADGKKTFTLTVEDKRIEIGLGLSYDAWTYDGQEPGPMLRVRQGDEVTVKLINPTAMAHGIDTHAAEVAPKRHFAAPDGQRNLSYTFRARVPGVFLYNCSAVPMLSHIANGMYGMMIVDPALGWPKAHEVMIVQGEYYGTPDKNGLVVGDSRKEVEERPDFVVFNGMVERYVDHPIPIRVGELVRIFFV